MKRVSENITAIVSITLMIGILIGGCFVGYLNAKGNNKELRDGCNSDNDDCNDPDSKCNSLVGTDNREEPFGCYVEGKITRGCAITAIREIRRAFDKSLSNTEKDALKYAEEQIYECAVIKINRRKGE